MNLEREEASEKMHRIRGLLVFLFSFAFVANALAVVEIGDTSLPQSCATVMTYDACVQDRYLSNGACEECPVGSSATPASGETYHQKDYCVCSDSNQYWNGSSCANCPANSTQDTNNAKRCSCNAHYNAGGFPTTLTVPCEPNVYTITLDNTTNGGSSNGAIYEKYDTGWSSTNFGTTITKLSSIPTKTNAVFLGYYDSATGSTQYIEANGNLPSSATTFGANTTIYAQFADCTCTTTTGVAKCTPNGVTSDNKCRYTVTYNAGYYGPATQTNSNAATASYTATATACATGSYSAAGASACTPCQNGTTTNGAGQSSCNATCSNSTNASTWEPATWNNNTVTNACTIATCSACMSGAGVAICAGTVTNNTCVYSGTCSTGYQTSNKDTGTSAICSGNNCSCTPRTYYVTYDCNTATMQPNGIGSAIFNVTFTPSATCNNPGYTFAGWKVDGTSDVHNGSFTWTYPDNKTLIAQWTPNTFTVNYNANGGAGSCESLSCTYGQSGCNAPSWDKDTCNFTYSDEYGGKRLIGWRDASNNATYQPNQNINTITTSGGTITLYAVWEGCQPFTLGQNAGGEFDSVYVSDNTCLYNLTCNDGYYNTYNNIPQSQVTSIDCTQCTNSKPDGESEWASFSTTALCLWMCYYNPDEGVYTTLGGTPNGAIYGTTNPDNQSCLPVTREITCNDQSVTMTQSSVANGDTSISKPTKTGYTFNGASIDSTRLPADLQSIQISIASNGNISGGWDFESQLYNIQDDFDPSVYTDPVPLSCQWTPNTYTVQLNLNANDATISGEKTRTFTYDTQYNIATPTRTGYTFNGWSVTGMDDTTHMYGEYSASTSTTATSMNLSKNQIYVKNLRATSGTVTFTAQWTPTQYTISYNLNNGTSGSYQPNSYTIETDTFTISQPTRDGYRFTGWNVTTPPASWGSDSSSPGAKDFKIGKGTYGNIAFAANWEQADITITFDSNGGSGTCQSVGCTYGGTGCDLRNWNSSTCNFKYSEEDPEDHSYDSRILVGWNTKADGTGTSYNLGAQNIEVPATNTTLYAVWNPCLYSSGTNVNETVVLQTQNNTCYYQHYCSLFDDEEEGYHASYNSLHGQTTTTSSISCTRCPNTKPENSHWTGGTECTWHCQLFQTIGGEPNGASSGTNGGAAQSCEYVKRTLACSTPSSGQWTTTISENDESIDTLPSITGYTFSGATSALPGFSFTINSSGNITSIYEGDDYWNFESYLDDNELTYTESTIPMTCSWTANQYTCSAGQYLPANSTSCQPCPAGKYCSSGDTYEFNASVDQGISGECPVGSYSAAGAAACTPCQTGYTTSGTGSTSASACVANTYTINFLATTTGLGEDDSISGSCASLTCTYNGTCKTRKWNTANYPYKCNFTHTHEDYYYVLTGWSTGENGAGTIYGLDADISGLVSGLNNGATLNLYAVWTNCADLATKGTNVSSINVDGRSNNTCKYIHTCQSDAYNNTYDGVSTTETSINCTACSATYHKPGNSTWMNNEEYGGACAWRCPSNTTLNGEPEADYEGSRYNSPTNASCANVQYTFSCTSATAGNAWSPTVNSGDTTVSTPTKPGYSFAGATYVYGDPEEPDLTAAISSSGAITSFSRSGWDYTGSPTNIEFECGWNNPITYTVAYNQNRPSAAVANVTGTTPSTSHTYGISKALRTNGYSLTGWTFAGWNTEADGSGTDYTNGQDVLNLTTENGGTVTLYAQWEQSEFNVTYSCGSGATGSAPTTPNKATYGQDFTLPNDSGTCTKGNYIFTGWTDGNNSYSPDEIITWNTSNDVEFTALWEQYQCESGKAANGSECAAGSYCPGWLIYAEDMNDSTNGCQRSCPPHSTNSPTSPAGSTAKTDCYVTFTGVEVENGHGRGDQKCNYLQSSQTYNDCKQTQIKLCYAGYYLVSETAPTCSLTDTGYWSPEPENNTEDLSSMAQYPCSALPDGNGATTAGTGSSSPTECYKTCDNQNIENGIRYTTGNAYFAGTISAYDHTNKTVTTSGSFSACEYNAPTCNAGYHASGNACIPNIYTFNLDKNTGSGGFDGPLYMKYGTGWYTDSNATIPASVINLPTKGEQNCTGYDFNSTQVIDNAGNIKASATLINDTDYETPRTFVASWVEKAQIVCQTGQYYDGTTQACKQCESGYHCSGGSAYVDSTTTQFRTPCPPEGYDPAQELSGDSLVNVAPNIGSTPGASQSSQCYATVQYNATNGKGSQKCYYNGSKYQSCSNEDITILTCTAGFYYNASTSTTDCTAAGLGYYSSDNVLTRQECPDHDTNVHVTTAKSNSSNIGECYKEGVWYDKTTFPYASDVPEHGGQTRRCYYDDTTGIKQYTKQCDSGAMHVCEAGYYYDSTINNNDCIPVESGYYSPSQQYFVENSGEDITPINAPGSSINRYECPNGYNGSDNGRDDIADCYAACPSNKYIPNSTSTSLVSGHTTAHYDESTQTYLSDSQCWYTVTCSTHYSEQDNNTANPSCKPNEYKVTLNDGGNVTTSGDGYIYAVYNTDWKDANQTNTINHVTIPSRGDDWSFKGYYTGQDSTGAQVIDQNGNFTSTYEKPTAFTNDNTVLYAGWTQDFKYCIAGYKTPVDSENGTPNSNDKCADDESSDAYYCPNRRVSSDTTDCRVQCPTDGNNTIHSDGDRQDVESCYSVTSGQALAIQSGESEPRGGGDKTCHYDNSEGAKTYGKNCTTYVRYCYAGYYNPAGATATTCADVMKGYYSPGPSDQVSDADSMNQYACTDLDGADNTATTDNVGAGKSANDCFIPQKTQAFSHGAGTAKCHYSSDNNGFVTCSDYTITSCDEGYWDITNGTSHNSVPDCVDVESGNYSPANNTNRNSCPEAPDYTRNSESPRAADKDCYYTCPATKSVTRTGSTPVDATVVDQTPNYNGNEYPTCKYTVDCGDGYTANGNDTDNPTCTPRNDTAYKVCHYTQNLGDADTYTLNGECEELTGTTGDSITLENKATDITGFTYHNGIATLADPYGETAPNDENADTNAYIWGDGTLVINLYYTRNTYTVTLTKGTGISAVSGAGTYEYEATATINAVLKPGYNWYRWTQTPGGTQVSTTQSYQFTVTGDVSYIANATPIEYNITYNLGGGTHGTNHPSTYTIESNALAISDPSRTGYIFNGWTVKIGDSDPVDTDGSYTVQTGTYGNIELTANWEEGDGIDYNVYYYTQKLNESTYELKFNETPKGKTGQELTLSNIASAHGITGFTYAKGVAGTSAAGTSLPNGNDTTTTILADGTRVISLYYTRNTYNVELTTGTGISTVSGANTYEYEAEVTIDASVKDGYEWNNWTKTGTSETVSSKEYTFAMGAGDVSYTANATPIVYNITYNLGGGNFGTGANHPNTYTIESNASAISDPSRTGYRFNGWTVKIGNNAPVDTDGSYTVQTGTYGDIELTANWTPNTYTITLSDNYTGGSTTTIREVYDTKWTDNNGQSLNGAVTIPVRQYYDFLGYFDAPNGVQKVIDENGTLPENTRYTSDTTLYAHWEKHMVQCATGYADTTQTTPCANGHYCPGNEVWEGDINDPEEGCQRACPPYQGRTDNVGSVSGASAVTQCFVTVQYHATHGNGEIRCHANANKVYLTSGHEYPTTQCDIDSINITMCDGGYYREDYGDHDCIKVGYGYYNPANRGVYRTPCPGVTDGDVKEENSEYTSDSDVSTTRAQCKRNWFNETTSHGKRKHACHYGTSAYDDTCINFVMTSCDAGYWDAQNGNASTNEDLDCVEIDDGHHGPVEKDGLVYPTGKAECPDVPYGQRHSDSPRSAITQCYYTCPAKTVERTGSTSVDAIAVDQTPNYDGNEYPTCKYTVNCDDGYTAYENNTENPTCTPNEYTVSLDANGGNVGTPSVTATYMADMPKLYDSDLPTRTGYTFDGFWDARNNGKQYYYDNGNSANVWDKAATATLYAHWTSDGYTVTYSCGEGSGNAPTPAPATFDTTFTPAANTTCTKVGYTFAGWQVEGTDDVQKDPFTWKYTSDKTFTATWNANVYTISLNDDGTTHGAPATLYVKYNTGWYTDENATQPIAQLTTLPAKNAYAFAGYKLGDLTVIDSTGSFVTNTFTTTNATLNVDWVAGQAWCQPGYYYTGVAANCAPCKVGYFCPGGNNFETDNGIQGMLPCPQGSTSNAGVAENTSCYRDNLDTYVTDHGSGTQTCFYNPDTDSFTEYCVNKLATKCDAGYYSPETSRALCLPVGQNYYSNKNEITRTPCPSTHPLSYGDTTPNIGLCYAECGMADHATQMTGRNYYNYDNGHCSIAFCQPGYYLPYGQDGACTLCPAGFYCDGTDGVIGNGSTSCATATAEDNDIFTDWMYSPAGSGSIEDCYTTCSERDVEYGHATPAHSTENYPTRCAFTGRSDTGNPCDIEQLTNGVCVESACNSNYEMINGVCQLCNRENATTYEQTGNCIVAQCAPGYHPHNDACVGDEYDCTPSIPHATIATSTWNTTYKTFGICKVEECDDGYHVESNACVPDEQTCAISNGIGKRYWNGFTWDNCAATSCDPGYTIDVNDRCVECYNKYEENGDLAVSSYVRECEIASCMYQGEKYELINGECVPICVADSDETGSKQWNPITQKCEYTCNNGYMPW